MHRRMEVCCKLRRTVVCTTYVHTMVGHLVLTMTSLVCVMRHALSRVQAPAARSLYLQLCKDSCIAAQEELQAKAGSVVSRTTLWHQALSKMSQSVHDPGDGHQGQSSPDDASCACRRKDVVPAGASSTPMIDLSRLMDPTVALSLPRGPSARDGVPVL